MKNLLRNFVVCLSAMFIISACTVDFRDPGHSPSGPTVYTEASDTSYIESEYETGYYYDDACWEEPYWFEPDWCDEYDDAQCCSWYVDGWYEEWCDWDYDGCWEYSGSY